MILLVSNEHNLCFIPLQVQATSSSDASLSAACVQFAKVPFSVPLVPLQSVDTILLVLQGLMTLTVCYIAYLSPEKSSVQPLEHSNEAAAILKIVTNISTKGMGNYNLEKSGVIDN